VAFEVEKEALGQLFSEYFDFPCQSFHQLFHTHHQPLTEISRARLARKACKLDVSQPYKSPRLYLFFNGKLIAYIQKFFLTTSYKCSNKEQEKFVSEHFRHFEYF
jgi:hypothetical protein